MIEALKREFIFFIFFFILVILALIYPSTVPEYPHFVDWKTIVILSGLLIITTGLKESRFFHVFSKNILAKIRTERMLFVFLVLLSAFLSTFLTNDITLFIVIPLTISIQEMIENNITKLIILEAISVNVGSALTPIGNPQNIYLWHRWGVSFLGFTGHMLPLVFMMFCVLVIVTMVVASGKELTFSPKHVEGKAQDRVLALFSGVLLVLYIVAIEMGYPLYSFLCILVIYGVLYGEVLIRVDWILILLFMVIFVDFRVISMIPAVIDVVGRLGISSPRSAFIFSAISSQVMSNVPASVFVSKFTHDWLSIAYGVNLGGNGVVIASLANIIALRIAGNRKVWLDFHIYSLPYFVFTGVVSYFLFF